MLFASELPKAGIATDARAEGIKLCHGIFPDTRGFASLSGKMFLKAISSLLQSPRCVEALGCCCPRQHGDAAPWLQRYSIMQWLPVNSWGEHLRQHERLTKADRELEERIRSYPLQRADGKTSHLRSTTLEATGLGRANSLNMFGAPHSGMTLPPFLGIAS